MGSEMSYTVESLTEVGMPIAMFALMEAAAKWEAITYKHIAERIEPIIRSPIASEHIGHVVGSMMYRIQDVEPAAPLLNLLCVNGVTKLPGSGAHGFIKAYNSRVDYNRLTKAEKREMLRPLMDEVYKFGGWSALAKKVFGVTANIQM